MSAELCEATRRKIENTIRGLTVDAVEAAGIGHLGAPLGLARPVFQLWDQHLRFDPGEPGWPLRDRFVLSAGHASMLLYALLHLFGYGLALDEIENFRQLGSRTPGHPEFGETPGVEVTTGPLGQGFGIALYKIEICAFVCFLRPLLTDFQHIMVNINNACEKACAAVLACQ